MLRFKRWFFSTLLSYFCFSITFPVFLYASPSPHANDPLYDPLRQAAISSIWRSIAQEIEDPTNKEAITHLQGELQRFLEERTEILPKSYPTASDRAAFQTALMTYNALKDIHPSLQQSPFNHLRVFLSYAWNKDKPEHGEIMLALAHALTVAGIHPWFDHFHNRPGTWVYSFTEKILNESDKVVIAGSYKLMEKYNSHDYSVLKAEIPQIQKKATTKPNTVIGLLLEEPEKIEKVLPPSLHTIASLRFHEMAKYCETTLTLLECLHELSPLDPYAKWINRNFQDKKVMDDSEIKRRLLLLQGLVLQHQKGVTEETINPNPLPTVTLPIPAQSNNNAPVLSPSLARNSAALQISAKQEEFKDNSLLPGGRAIAQPPKQTRREKHIQKNTQEQKEEKDVNDDSSSLSSPRHTTHEEKQIKALARAIDKGDIKAIEAFLKISPDVEVLDHKSRSLLERACYAGHLNICEMLIKRGANVNHQDQSGNTPLYMASTAGHETIVEMLLNQQAAIDQADDRGVTPLHMAAQKGDVGIVEILCQKGANVMACAFSGQTPSSLAKKHSEKTLTITDRNNYEQIKQCLLKYGAPFEQ